MWEIGYIISSNSAHPTALFLFGFSDDCIALPMVKSSADISKTVITSRDILNLFLWKQKLLNSLYLFSLSSLINHYSFVDELNEQCIGVIPINLDQDLL